MNVKIMNFKCVFLVFLMSFGSLSAQNKFKSVVIDTLLIDNISIRAIIAEKNKVWYAGDKGRYGSIDLQTKLKAESQISENSKLELRSIAANSKYIYLLGIGNPAFLYQISKNSNEIKLVYQENHDKVFYDSMQFWNETDGIAIGDPIEDTFSIIITRNGGNSWKKIASQKIPKLKNGEAAFAASNSNIVLRDNKTWIVSGGKESRVFYSPNKGKIWEVYDTPIVKGKEMTGIFTADFYDPKNGFVAGGNYEKPDQNFGNKAITTDGGQSWKLVGENTGPGYISCVQYFPKSNGKKMITVGATGIHYTFDGGETWSQLSDDKDLFTIRFLDEKSAIVAGKDKILRLQFHY